MRVRPERKLTAKELMLLNCGVREDSWEPPGLQRAQTSQYYRKSILNIHWKDWCWSSNTLAPWWKELTHWKRPQYWEKLKVGGEGDDREWNGWMASLTQWTWVWASSRSWWWMGKPGVLRFMGSQRIRHDWVTELNWTSLLHSQNLMCVSHWQHISGPPHFQGSSHMWWWLPCWEGQV